MLLRLHLKGPFREVADLDVDGIRLVGHQTELAQLHVLDTYDCDILHSGRILLGFTRNLFLYPLVIGGKIEPLSTIVSGTLPVSVKDIPSFSIRDMVMSIAPYRALSCIAEIPIECRAVYLIDDQQKTVARGELLSLCLQPDIGNDLCILNLEPLRGYSDELCDWSKRESGGRIGSITFVFAAIVDRIEGIPPLSLLRPCTSFDPGVTVPVAVADNLHRLLDIMVHNVDGIVRDVDTECLHRHRVALRRARSLLSMFKKGLPHGESATLRNTLGLVCRHSNALRDADVLLLAEEDMRESVPAELRDGVAELFAGLGRRREELQYQFVQYLKSPAFDKSIASIRDVLDSDTWSSPCCTMETMTTVREMAVKQASKAVKRARDVLRHMHWRQVSTRELHTLRIACKKTRYLLEFAGVLTDDDDMLRIAKDYRFLQNCLGRYNDSAVQQELLAQVTVTAARPENINAAAKSLLSNLQHQQDVSLLRAERRAKKLAEKRKDRNIGSSHKRSGDSCVPRGKS